MNNACLAIQNAMPSLKQVLWTDKPNTVCLVGLYYALIGYMNKRSSLQSIFLFTGLLTHL